MNRSMLYPELDFLDPVADNVLELGRYGVTEVYTRVSKYVSWIRQTMSAS